MASDVSIFVLCIWFQLNQLKGCVVHKHFQEQQINLYAPCDWSYNNKGTSNVVHITKHLTEEILDLFIYCSPRGPVNCNSFSRLKLMFSFCCFELTCNLRHADTQGRIITHFDFEKLLIRFHSELFSYRNFWAELCAISFISSMHVS